MNTVELPIDVSEVFLAGLVNAIGMLYRIVADAPWWFFLLVSAVVFLHLVQPAKPRRSLVRSRRYDRHTMW